MNDMSLSAVLVGGPHEKFLRDWQRRYVGALQSAFAYAKKMKARGWQPGFDGDLIGLVFDTPIPQGWRQIRRKSWCVPHKDNKKALDEIARLVQPPSLHEVETTLGLFSIVSYECGDGFGSSVIGDAFRPVQLSWVSERGKLFVHFPDAAAARKKCLIENPGAKINIPARWAPPLGLKVLTPPEYQIAWAKEQIKFKSVT